MAAINQGRMQAVREIMEPCCDPGAVVRYRGLKLEKPVSESDHQMWVVSNGDGWLETINVAAIASASELKNELDALADAHAQTVHCQCDCCCHSLPGD